jgi:sec-independent protein translocase protein TatA
MSFMGIGPMELLVIVVLALLVLGPTRLAKTARSVGRFARQMRRTTEGLPNMVEELLEGGDEAAQRPSSAKAQPQDRSAPSGTQPWSPTRQQKPASPSPEERRTEPPPES